MRASFFVVVLLASLAGCDQLGIESSAATAARREAEGKAIGGGCRHAARSLEDCYEQNKRADKAAVFAGWREMNDYMRENKIEAQPPAAEPPAVEVAAAEAAGEGDAAGEAKAEAKNAAKSDAKDKAGGKAAKTARP